MDLLYAKSMLVHVSQVEHRLGTLMGCCGQLVVLCRLFHAGLAAQSVVFVVAQFYSGHRVVLK